jgi:hypothetical protein
MPKLIITEDTARLIREQAPPGFGFRETATRLEDGRRELVVDDEAYATINEARLPGETDDDVVARLVRSAIGRKVHLWPLTRVTSRPLQPI